jgi:hypothetical protein
VIWIWQWKTGRGMLQRVERRTKLNGDPRTGERTWLEKFIPWVKLWDGPNQLQNSKGDVVILDLVNAWNTADTEKIASKSTNVLTFRICLTFISIHTICLKT